MKVQTARGLVLSFLFLSLSHCDSNSRRAGNPSRTDGGTGPGPTYDDGGMPSTGGDPTTCAEAAANKSYIGCEYWPTVTANGVWSVFDFTAVVANPQSVAAMVTITGPKGFTDSALVAPGTLTKFYLPWVPRLKGTDFDEFTAAQPLNNSVLERKGAYHLVSSVPVTVYQFNALEYKGQGGPATKNWSSCPGNLLVGCFSFSNDASLLLPTSALTGNYRITGHGGWGEASVGAYVAITATQDGTTVKIKTSSTGNILAGDTIPATAPTGMLTLTLDAGDVAELVGTGADVSDLSGSLVQADKPVQVIAGLPCLNNPSGQPACDHTEESVFPAETLGKHYIVTVPTAPGGTPVGHTVRIYGNVDGTQLTYQPAIVGAPAIVNAGQVVDLGQVSKDFEVEGDHEFAVSSFMLGASVVDPTGTDQAKGDPSQSLATAVEQYRKSYIFLTPDDYDLSYVDAIVPTNSGQLMLDGAAVSQTMKAVGTSKFGVIRIPLNNSKGGAHTLSGAQPFGIQVLGYGSYTSYQYPGGLDLQSIAPAPIF